MNFEDQVADFCKRTNAEVLRVCHQAMRDLNQSLVEASPLGLPGSGGEGYHPGTFQSNWTVSAGSPEGSLSGYEEEDKASAFALNLHAISLLKADEVWFVANNTPYGPPIEFEQWSGKRFPHTKKGVIRPIVLGGGWQLIVEGARLSSSEGDEVPF